MEESVLQKRPNQLIWEDRKKLTAGGIIQVERFDEQTVVMETDLGTLTVKGENLHVERLNIENGEVAITGHLNGLLYTGNESKTGWLNKVFR